MRTSWIGLVTLAGVMSGSLVGAEVVRTEVETAAPEPTRTLECSWAHFREDWCKLFHSEDPHSCQHAATYVESACHRESKQARPSP